MSPQPILIHPLPTLGSAYGRGWRPFWQRTRAWVATAISVSRERHQLANLDDRMLRDVGLGRGEASREASRDLMDVPRSRLTWF